MSYENKYYGYKMQTDVSLQNWHCLVSYQDYKKSKTKQFRSHAVKAIYDPVFHEIFGFKVRIFMLIELVKWLNFIRFNCTML